MDKRNGYFELDIRDDASYVRIYPPVDGGEPVSVKELTYYLEERGITGYNIKDLNSALSGADRVIEAVAGRTVGFHVGESTSIDVTMDKMTAVCRFYPPSNGGGMLSAKDIIDDLRRKGIKHGIDAEAIESFLSERKYCTDYILARGTDAIVGKNAEITYFFNTDHSLKPKTNEDGTVDYRNLNMISQVTAGERLAHLTPADMGKVGSDVFGTAINPPRPNNLKLSAGRNMHLSEDGLDLFSDVNGHASLVNGKVFVSDVYEVGADVDNSTGNIDYEGNVTIKGNVKDGFSVKAGGDIIIEGVVEGAKIVAGGQIIVKRGIHGMTKGVLQAKENIICKFIENATVSSQFGYVETDTIIHSRVSAGGEVRVTGKKGFITGGSIRSGEGVFAKTIGSDMGTATTIIVGLDPAKQERLAEINDLIKANETEIEKIRPVLSSFSEKLSQGIKLDEKRMHYVQVLASQFKNKQSENDGLKVEKANLSEELSKTTHARIKVSQTVYPGVSIEISGASMTLKDAKNNSCFVKKDGEIQILPL